MRRREYSVDEDLASEIRRVIDLFPYYGVRRITWRIRKNQPDRAVNWKKVHRILKLKGWVLNKKPRGMRPRVLAWRSRTDEPNRQWAIDTSHFFTQRDGWCHITAVIDCCDRSIVGWRISRSGKAQIAAAALEDALIRRNPSPGLKLRSDNGLVFGAEAFFKTVRGAQISQEFITPYTPEQNGMIERWFRTLKEECLWLNNFKWLEEARTTIEEFILRYNNDRPHRALGMLSPSEWSEKYAA
jgi:putative transposase